MIQMFALALLFTALWVAPSRAASDIRGIDFLNFTYQPTLCSGEEGIGKSVLVRNGEWNGEEAYYRINKVVYGDLTGDGREDAVVDISCGSKAANFSQSEILIYGLQGQHASLIARLDDSDLDRAYRKYNANCTTSDNNPSCGVWSGIRDLQIVEGKLVLESLAEGYHAGPKYIVKFTYRIEGGKLVLAQKPQKRRFEG